ncbi:MAG: PD40 domain-containing protein [Lentisphaeria bacterium]|nr:PD40 domain-containing protein [Lentisphaeria bacterium]
MKKLIAFLAVFGLFVSVNSLYAEAIVIKKGSRANPTLRIASASVSESLKSEVARMLKVANWFDVTNSGGDFLLDLSGNEYGLNYRLISGGQIKASGRVNGNGDVNMCAKVLVDDILKKVFKIPVLCRSKIVFSVGKSMKQRNIAMSDIDGKNFEQITRFSGLAVEPAFAPSGRSIVYSSYGKNNISIFETLIYPRKTRKISSFAGLNTGAAVSPDGRYLTMILSKDKQVDLYIRDMRSRQLIRLTRDKAVESSPCFSPDGRFICFLSDKSGRPKLYMVNLQGSQVKLLPSVGREAFTPDWSQDNKIAYITRIDGEYRIAILDINSGRNELVPNLTGRWESPSWAPDNRHLVCSKSDSPMSSTLYVIDSWTGKYRKLFSSKNYFSTPNWSKVAID